MKKIYFAKLLMGLGLCLPAVSVFGSTSAALKMIKEIEGVYKHKFSNAMIGVGKAPLEADAFYSSEDIVEVMPYDTQHIYLRAKLHFYNGHICSLYGIAEYEDGRFVYRTPKSPAQSEPKSERSDDSVCTLTLSKTTQGLHLTDRITSEGGATCRRYCGQRGSLSDLTLPMTSKRPISYQTRIRKSREFQTAVSEFESVSDQAKH